MFEEEQQYLFSKEHEEKRLGANSSEQDIQIEVLTVQAPTDQINAIGHTIKRNNNSNITTVSTGTVTNNNISLIRDEERDITMKVRTAGDALYDSVVVSIDKARRKSVEKAKEVVTRDANPAAAIVAKKDAQDIAALGDSVEGLARTFEILMTEIRKKPYSEQVRLLTGYKKLLKEQINVIDSRINMAKRLK